MSKFARNNHTSHNGLSSISSNSFGKYDDTNNDKSLDNMPLKAEKLPSGLIMVLDENFVH